MKTEKASIHRVRHAQSLIVIVACLVIVSTGVGAQEEIPVRRALRSAFSENGRYLAVLYGLDINGFSDSGGDIWLYDLENLLLPPHELVEGTYASISLKFSPNSRYLALGNYQNLSVFNLEDKVSILDLHRTSTEVPTDFYTTAFNSESSHIMAFSHLWAREPEMSIWSIDSAERIQATAAKPGRRRTYRSWLSPDFHQYVIWSDYSEGGTIVYEYDIHQGLGRQLARLPGRTESAVFSPDGSLFAVEIGGLIGEKVKIQVYETAAWSQKRTIVTDVGTCEADVGWRFSHDNTYLAFVHTCFETRIFVWNLSTEEVLLNSVIDQSFVRFTRNNKFLVAAGMAGISVWNIEDKLEFTEYPGSVPRLHQNNELMATIGPDDRVWIWNIESKQLLVILPIPQK